SRWIIRGTIPVAVVIVNNDTPVKVIATKQAPDFSTMSLQLTVGFTVQQVSSTTQPFGVVTLQTSTSAPGFDPPPPLASNDVRIFVKAPLAERFSGLIEDQDNAFIISDRSPTLFLFDSPNGRIDGLFNQIQ